MYYCFYVHMLHMDKIIIVFVFKFVYARSKLLSEHYAIGTFYKNMKTSMFLAERRFVKSTKPSSIWVVRTPLKT